MKIIKKAKLTRIIVYVNSKVRHIIPKLTSEFFSGRLFTDKSNQRFRKIGYPKSIMTHKKRNERNEYLEYKEKTRMIVLERLNYFNQFYNHTWNRISIKNTKSRWGSCSTHKNLNFSYKLALIDKDLADYVIVHELCHLKEMNHSKDFWALVSKTTPKYKHLRKQLQQIHYR